MGPWDSQGSIVESSVKEKNIEEKESEEQIQVLHIFSLAHLDGRWW